MMDERQETILRVFTKKQLMEMSADDLVKLVGEMPDNAKIHAKGVVRRKDGSIKYAADALPGNFGESQAELKANADASD